MQKLAIKLQYFLIALLMVGVFTSCDKDDDPVVVESKNIVQTAVGDPQFSILVSALQKANLVSALEDTGPFTVFAPTNAAFNALFAQLDVSGINDLSAEILTPILLNHVVSGSVKSTDIATGYANTLNSSAPGQNFVNIYIEKTTSVKVDGSNVTAADVMASNGVIHVIDKVIVPASVVSHAINNPGFSTLVAAVLKADLASALSATGPFTVFAPTNEAFAKLFTALGVSGIADLTAEQLTPILLYHVVSGNARAAQVTSGSVPTLNTASNIDVVVTGGSVKLNGTSNVIATDVQGTNGVIHVIDTVLVP